MKGHILVKQPASPCYEGRCLHSQSCRSCETHG